MTPIGFPAPTKVASVTPVPGPPTTPAYIVHIQTSGYTLKFFKIIKRAGWWWHTPLIPAVRRQRQVDLCELEASLV